MLIASKPFEVGQKLSAAVKFISPNIYELGTIGKFFGAAAVPFDEISRLVEQKEVLEFTTEMCSVILPHVDTVILTLGHHGVVIATKNTPGCGFFSKDLTYMPALGHPSGRFYPAAVLPNVVSVSGAGDSFASGFIAAMLKGKPEAECVSVGFEATKHTLASSKAVPEALFDENHECWSQTTSFVKDFQL